VGLGDHHHCQVGEPCVEIVVSALHVNHDPVVVGLEVGDREPAGPLVVEERQAGRSPEAASERAVHLSGDPARG